MVAAAHWGGASLGVLDHDFGVDMDLLHKHALGGFLDIEADPETKSSCIWRLLKRLPRNAKRLWFSWTVDTFRRASLHGDWMSSPSGALFFTRKSPSWLGRITCALSLGHTT